MDFSIVIPAYNEAKYLSSCIEHIKKQQGGFEFEIIVVDNNSTDETYKIAKDLDVRVIKETVQGVGQARKTGTEMAQGKYILHIDADTRLPENYLLEVVKRFESDLDLVCLGGQFYFYDGKWRQNFLRPILFRLAYWISFLSSFGKIGPIANNMVFKRVVYYKTSGFNKDLQYGEDGDLASKLSEYGKVRIKMDLKCFVSSRRFTKIDKNFYLYFWNAIWVAFFGRPYKNGLEHLKEK